MKGLKTKFIVYFVLLIVFISVSFLAFFIQRLNSLTKDNLTELGFVLVRNLSYSSELAVASEDEIFLKPYFEKIFQEKDVVVVAIYNEKGRIILADKKTEIEERMPREVMEKLKASNDVIKRESYTQNQEKVYDFYYPVMISEILEVQPRGQARELAGFARVGLSLKSISEQNKKIISVGFGISLLLIFLGTVTAVFFAQKMTKPIKQLIVGAETIGKGNLDYRIKIKTGDEIEELGKTFNQMAEDLKRSHAALEESREVLEIKVKARTKELEELNQQLEARVEQRTKDLQQRIEELERFHKLTVGRELKMIELKKELRQTKEKIEKPKGRK